MASSSSSSQQSRFQVFLSFRGEDTRQNFTSHLLEALKRRGISVFFDEEKLEKGGELSSALLRAIAASKVSIVILSKDYASSKSCLTELSKIMECKLTQGQHVLPIFYKVNPSDVRHQTGSFEESFNQHLIKKPEEVESWKAAFTQAGNLKGWHIDGGNFDRSEPEYIEDIVKVVTNKLGSNSTNVSKDLVGIDHQMEHIVQLIEQEKFRVIGILGMGGIGKTTLADAVYNKVLSCSNKFDAHHFLHNVRERSLETNGLQSLRKELLSKLLGEDINIDTQSIGSTLIQDRLHMLRALVVLDDVDDKLDQIKYLGVEFFGVGSKIIVTSRDRQVLRNIEVDIWHQVNVLSGDDSLQLFSKHAFKQYNYVAGFQDVAKKFVGYAGGIPLALKVLGAALFGKSRREWEGAWDKLQEYPEKGIFGPLKISYDGLGDLEKNIFLDIACFHIGKPKDEVEEILQCCYKGAEFGIGNLVDKCLVEFEISWNSKYFRMHDLLQEMGRDIARQERNRLWSPEDVCYVLKNNKGIESIKGISMNMYPIKAVHISHVAFEKMVNLEFIDFYDQGFGMCGDNKLLLLNQNLTYLPDSLRYFRWDDCPLESLPSNFSPYKLVILRLCNSNIEQLWNGDEDVVNLRAVDVSGCKKLRKIPNLIGATKLEKLVCYGCKSLVEIPCMRHLTTLKELNLDGCPITKFPEIQTNGALEELNLSGTKIEEVPSLMWSLKKLEYLNMSGTKIRNIPSNILKSDALVVIYLPDCANLRELNFNTTPMEEAPSSKSLLMRLNVGNCKSLKSLLGLPNIADLNAENCTSLERVLFRDRDPGDHYPNKFGFIDCSKLSENARNNIIERNKIYESLRASEQLARDESEEAPSLTSWLVRLNFGNCKSLKSILGLPNVVDLNAQNCTSLETVSFKDRDPGDHYSYKFDFTNCSKLSEDARNNIIAMYPMIRSSFEAKRSAKQLAKDELDDFNEDNSSTDFNSDGQDVLEEDTDFTNCSKLSEDSRNNIYKTLRAAKQLAKDELDDFNEDDSGGQDIDFSFDEDTDCDEGQRWKKLLLLRMTIITLLPKEF